MALSNPRILYGVHSVSPYNRTTGEFYGILKVLAGSSFNMSGETVELRGGSLKFPWAVEDGNVTAELTINTKEYPDFLFELFLGKAPTQKAVDADGEVGTITNVKGTSAVSASAGIASVAALSGDTADLKFGKYIVKVVSATTVDVYLSSDIDMNRGTDGSYVNDLLKINASPITIPNASTVSVADFGLEFTGGTTVSMTIGDTAEFLVLPVHNGGMEVVIGGTSDVFPEFGAVVMTQKRATGELFEIDIFRLKGSGMNIGAEEKAFSESALTASAFYDSAKNGICKIRALKA